MKRLFYKICRIWQIISNALYWLVRDIKYSEFYRGRKVLLNRLLITGHVIEKGITMRNRRLGFGLWQVRSLISLCQSAQHQDLTDTDQYLFALKDLYEYRKIHQNNNFDLPKDIKDGIDSLLDNSISSYSACMTRESFFDFDGDFKNFAKSRHSVRIFSEEVISDEQMEAVVELAQTAPSACNRQSVKIHIYDGEAKNNILRLQNGNRGWGETANKIIIVTSEQTAWDGYFTKAAYLDGGIYTMNLLYALHYYGICSCCLNLYLHRKEMNALRKASGIPDSEIPVVMIAIGYPPKHDFMIARSNRIDFHRILSFHH